MIPIPRELAPVPILEDENQDDGGQTNPTYGELIDNLEEEHDKEPEDNSDIQNMTNDLDDLMTEIQEELVPAGEQLLTGGNENSEAGILVEDVEDDDEEQDDEPDPVERLIRPRQETREIDRLTYVQTSTNEIPRMKTTYADACRRSMEREIKHNLFQQNTRGNKEKTTEYRNNEAVVAGHFMSDLK